MDLSGVTRDVVVPVRIDRSVQSGRVGRSGRRGPTPDEAKGPHWRCSSRGLYVPAHVDATRVDQRTVEAAAALPGEWGAVTGWAGLSWIESVWFDGTPWGGGPVRPVTLAVGGNRAIRPQPGIATSEERLLETDVILVDGVRVTTAVRSVCFEMRYARSLRDAVISLDMACFNDAVSLDEVAAYAATLSGWTGIPRCRAAIPLARENCWSPQEAGMRMCWEVDAGMPPPVCNVPVFGPDGRLLGTPDLLDPVAGVAGEYDSALHLTGQARSRDERREHLFRSHGLEYVTMLTGDAGDPTHFIRRLLAAYDRAADIPASRRRWTIEPPGWWRDTTTVEARRALDADTRRRLLAHRAA